MQRKVTKRSRGPNAYERRFHIWVKQQPCIVSGAPGPSILHHCEGSTFKHNKVLIGHWFVLPLCEAVDDVVTKGSRRKFREEYGPQSEYWFKLWHQYAWFRKKSSDMPPAEVINAIQDWGR